jgi:hypothetical protein
MPLMICCCSFLRQEILDPLGVTKEELHLPLSPRSEQAYKRINEEFEFFYRQLPGTGATATPEVGDLAAC